MKDLFLMLALGSLTLIALPVIIPLVLWELWNKPDDAMTGEEYAKLLRLNLPTAGPHCPHCGDELARCRPALCPGEPV